MTGRASSHTVPLALLLCCLQGCAAGEADDRRAGGARAFFQGKTLTYIVATEPGGSYDTYGRLVSSHLVKYLGLSRVVVRNVPGGGHIRGANDLAAARPDGLTLGTFNTGLIYAQILGRDGLRLDLREMSWIGKAGREPRVLVVSGESGFQSFDDIRRLDRPLLLGSSGYGSEGYHDSILLAHALGHQVRFVFGLTSRAGQLSMMRGEIDGQVGSASSYRAFVDSGYGSILLRVGDDHGVDLDVAIPDALSLVTTAEGQAIVDFVARLATLMRWTAGPPGISEDRLAVLRDAYQSALRDPALLSEAHRLRIPIAPMDGATLAREVDRMLAQPAWMAALLTSIADGIPAS